MTRNLMGRRLLITGASKGIGRALAEQAAGLGARLMVTARSADQLQQLTEQLNGEVAAIPADITSSDDRERILQAVNEKFGGLDVLINNAGVASFGHFSTSTESVLRQVMEVNFFAPAELMRGAVPLLRQGDQPAIVNVASMCGRCAMPAWPEYSASKFALCGLTEALRAEFARWDIDMLLIVPGLTRTEFRAHQIRHEGKLQLDLNKGLAPEEAARLILRALQRNKSETVLGYDARWMIRVHRWLPGLFSRLLARKVRKLYGKA